MFWASFEDEAVAAVFVEEQLTAMSKKSTEARVVVHFMISRL
jgi:hypothetical protein